MWSYTGKSTGCSSFKKCAVRKFQSHLVICEAGIEWISLKLYYKKNSRVMKDKPAPGKSWP